MVKVYRIIQVFENARVENEGFMSLIATMNSLDGWKFEGITYSGTDVDREELHRYALTFTRDVEYHEALGYVCEEVVKKNPDSYSSFEELKFDMEKIYDSRLRLNQDEISQQYKLGEKSN